MRVQTIYKPVSQIYVMFQIVLRTQENIPSDQFSFKEVSDLIIAILIYVSFSVDHIIYISDFRSLFTLAVNKQNSFNRI